jgi:ArsR family transcriptional regulator
MAIELNENNAELIARRFKALADPSRLRILNELRERGEASVGEIASALETSQQNVSKHLATLHDQGFLARRRDGTSARYSISDPAVLDLCDAVCARIEAQLERTGALLGGRP